MHKNKNTSLPQLSLCLRKRLSLSPKIKWLRDTYDLTRNVSYFYLILRYLGIATQYHCLVIYSYLHCLPDYGCVTVRPISPVSVSSVTSIPAIVTLPHEAAMKEGPKQVSLGQERGGHQSSLTCHMTRPMTWWWHSPCRSPSLSWGQPQHPGPGPGSRGGRQADHREPPTVHSAIRWCCQIMIRGFFSECFCSVCNYHSLISRSF